LFHINIPYEENEKKRILSAVHICFKRSMPNGNNRQIIRVLK
jgi:hypothetical protein